MVTIWYFSYVLVIDELHELKFPVRPFGMSDILKGAAEFLDGDVRRGHRVNGGTTQHKTHFEFHYPH